MEAILRGDIYYAALENTLGSEQSGHRPVVVLQCDVLNLNAPTAIVAPVTTVLKHPFMQSHTILRADCPLRERSMVLTEQLRAIDRRRLGAYVGTLRDTDLHEIEQALHFSLGLPEYREG